MISRQKKKKQTFGNKKPNRNRSLYDYITPANKQSKNDATYHNFRNWNTVEYDGHTLPGTKEPHKWCGQWVTGVCRNCDEHERRGYGKRPYVKRYQRSCYRASCGTCSDKSIIRAAEKAARRVTKYSTSTIPKPHHRVLSPPKEDLRLPEKKLRKKALAIIKIAQLEAGGLVFHHVKRNFDTMMLEVYPHYHYVGFGYAENTDRIFSEYGWILPYKGIRKTNFGTFKYLLSHCGVKDGRQRIIWTGKLANRKFKGEKRTSNNKCPACGKELVLVSDKEIDFAIPANKYFEGFVEKIPRK